MCIRDRITYKRLFGPNDFSEMYHSYQGSALGLAHTLTQTAFGRPSFKSKKVSNLFYVGASQHPGIGMPVCLISGQVASEYIIKHIPC
jgi:phytoene dehydrogenase-like protein